MKQILITLSLILGLGTIVVAQKADDQVKVKYYLACSPFVDIRFTDDELKEHSRKTKPFWLSVLDNGDFIIEDGDRAKKYNRELFTRLSVNGDTTNKYAKDGDTILVIKEYYDFGDYFALVKFKGSELDKISRTICAN